MENKQMVQVSMNGDEIMNPVVTNSKKSDPHAETEITIDARVTIKSSEGTFETKNLKHKFKISEVSPKSIRFDVDDI